MFCTTECFSCEDKNCSHYIDKTKLYFEKKRLENIINGMEKFFKDALDNEVRPLGDYSVSVWSICLHKLEELKEGK